MRRADARRKPVTKAAPVCAPRRTTARVVSLLDPEIVLERTARRFLPEPLDRCVKCHSTFIAHEPADLRDQGASATLDGAPSR